MNRIISKIGAAVVTIPVYRGIKMARAKYQVLVIPYHVEKENIKYCFLEEVIWMFGNLSPYQHTALKKRDKYGVKIV